MCLFLLIVKLQVVTAYEDILEVIPQNYLHVMFKSLLQTDKAWWMVLTYNNVYEMNKIQLFAQQMQQSYDHTHKQMYCISA